MLPGSQGSLPSAFSSPTSHQFQQHGPSVSPTDSAQGLYSPFSCVWLNSALLSLLPKTFPTWPHSLNSAFPETHFLINCFAAYNYKKLFIYLSITCLFIYTKNFSTISTEARLILVCTASFTKKNSGIEKKTIKME